MKHWGLLVWIPQFGISVAAPLVIFIVLANWLQTRYALGGWVMVVGILLGLITAAVGFRDTVVAMLAQSGHHKEKAPEPQIFFNSHS